MKRRAVKSADEHDAYTDWRRALFWQKGELKKIKRRTHKRERREGKTEIKDQS